jgi:hypothetical protein
MRNLSRREAVQQLAVVAAVLAGWPAAGLMAADRSPVAIKGYDPVAYFTLGKPTPGRPQIWYEWDERRYLFSSAEHRDLFKADPVRYAPQFPDYCAMSLTRGEIVEANPEYWLVSDGKLYMFGKPVGPGLFQQNLEKNVSSANQHRGLVQKR